MAINMALIHGLNNKMNETITIWVPFEIWIGSLIRKEQTLDFQVENHN